MKQHGLHPPACILCGQYLLPCTVEPNGIHPDYREQNADDDDGSVGWSPDMYVPNS